MATNNHPRDKLGLALAGGGFRASLFHIGVLRRMAELDLLRYLEVLSTVSGGSIVGALYILLLKKGIDDSQGVLGQKDYLKIVDDLEERMRTGIKKNLRTRLFLNPLGILRVMLTEHSMGKRMAKIYERYVYKKTVQELKVMPAGWLRKNWVPPWFRRRWGAGQILLDDTKMRPGGEPITGDIESYNRAQVKLREKGSTITKLIVNATSLNSGTRFWFSAAEIGDWTFGYFRKDEIDDLLKRKDLLDEMQRKHGSAVSKRIRSLAAIKRPSKTCALDEKIVSLANWWVDKDFKNPAIGWEKLFESSLSTVIEPLCSRDLGLLRRTKLAAYHLKRIVASPDPTMISGGLNRNQHLADLAFYLGQMCYQPAGTVRTWIKTDESVRDSLLDFVYELYLLRSAEKMSRCIRDDWSKLTLGQAVAASANFPPLFPPFQITGIYDDIEVSRLGLTDGGVYDNLGIFGLLDERCNYIIVSDTGGLLNPKQRSSEGRLGMMFRIINVLTADEGRQKKTNLLEKYRVSTGLSRIAHDLDKIGITDQKVNSVLADLAAVRELHGLAVFHIDSSQIPDDASGMSVSPKSLAKIRTDLDGFGDIEMNALINQGYANAEYFIKKYLDPEDENGRFLDRKDQFRYSNFSYPYKNTKLWKEEPAKPLRTMGNNQKLVKRTIKVAQNRFFRVLYFPVSLSWFISWFITLALLVGILFLVREHTISVAGLINGLSVQILGWLEKTVPLLASGWTQTEATPLTFVFGIGVVVLAFILARKFWFPLVDKLNSNGFVTLARWFARIARWPKSYKGNLMWIIVPLPILIAFGGAALAWFSHLVYKWPWLVKTRLKKRNGGRAKVTN